MHIHVSSGNRKPYNPKIGDRKETKKGVFRRVPRLAFGGWGRGRRVMGTQVSGSRPLYDWIEEKYFTDKFEPGSAFNRTKEWWDEQERR